jgi:hypothetical protein
MIRRLVVAFLFLAAGLALGAPACANVLYLTTQARDLETGDPVGHLYTIDLGLARSRLVGPIRVGGVVSVAVTGLAMHPTARVLYGITVPSSRLPPSLVTIDPYTATAVVVGPLKATGSDIDFDSKGTLFIWLSNGSQLGVVDLRTGAASALGVPGTASTSGGGLAIDRRGKAFVAASSSTGALDQLDVLTGKRVGSHELYGAPLQGPINSLTYSPTGILVGVNSDARAPGKSALVMINGATGAVTPMGSLPDGADALTFDRDAGSALSIGSKHDLLLIILGVLVGLLGLGAIRWRPSRTVRGKE